MSLLIPFNYLTDGVYTRAGIAWHTIADGTIVETAENDRRLSVQGDGLRWIWIEGGRENHITDPLDMTSVAWSTPAGGTTTIALPTGVEDTTGLMNASSFLAQVFDTGSRARAASVSAYVRGVGGAQTATILVLNGTPATGDSFSAPTSQWVRAARKGVSLVVAADKTFQLSTSLSNQMAVWGCVAESGPGWGDARFPSQPVLAAERGGDLFKPGIITAAMVAKEPLAVVISFEPEYDSADLGASDEMTLLYLDTGVAGTSIRVWLAYVGVGDVRIRAGFASGAMTETAAVTFYAGAPITVTLALASGDITASGLSVGDGVYAGATAFPLLADMEVTIGSALLGNTPAFALMGPFALGYTSIDLAGFEQLTLNSARVTFTDDVLQFDPRGATDALNPINYNIEGTPGLPSIQHVRPGDAGDAVTVFFDDIIPAGALLRLVCSGIVGAPVAIPMESVSTAFEFIAFGGEVNLVAQSSATYPRVDIANPQDGDADLGTFRVTDAGDLGNDHGRAYLQKRVMRRISTVRSGFYHLIDYGVAAPSKRLFTATTLRRLKMDIEGQVRQEPGVLAALATVTELRPGVVAVKLRIQDDNGSFELEGALDFTAE